MELCCESLGPGVSWSYVVGHYGIDQVKDGVLVGIDQVKDGVLVGIDQVKDVVLVGIDQV